MNNIAIPKRIELTPTAQILSLMRGVLPVVVLCTLWISLQPFQGAQTQAPTSSLANQIVYTLLLGISLGMLLFAVDRRVVLSMLSLPWIVLLCGLCASTLFSPSPSDAIRAVAFSCIATVLAASFFALPPSADALSRTLRVGCFAVLALCYAGVLAMPATAIHQAGEVESQHVGLWRGLYAHKNIAGPIMATIAFAGIYIFRRGMRLSGGLVILVALLFIANTGSKTSLAITPAVAIMVLLPALMGMRGLAAFLVFAAALTTHALTIGTVYSPLLDSVLRIFSTDTSYTGRIEIWEFSKPFFLENLWTGFGYDGFWLTDITAFAEQPFDRVWDPRSIVHGHNGFLDIGILMGLPMLLVAVWALLIAPVYDYLRVPNRRENILLADFLLMVVAFTVMNAALESFFFRRADPVWISLVFAVFGLRFAARLPIGRS